MISNSGIYGSRNWKYPPPMKYVKPQGDPSKTLAIILIGACLMLIVDLFVLDGKSMIWPVPNKKLLSTEQVAQLKEQNRKYLDEGVLKPVPRESSQQFMKQMNLQGRQEAEQKSTADPSLAALPYEEFYYNADEINDANLSPAAGNEEQQEKPSSDPYFKTEVKPLVDEDIKEEIQAPDAPPAEQEKASKAEKESTQIIKLANVHTKEIGPPPAASKDLIRAPTPIAKGTVVIIIDDMGLSAHSREVEDLPGPLTLSYLPYAQGLPARTAYAKKHGHELMVHMPMEPENSAIDGGPTLLKGDQSEEKFHELLRYNLEQFSGYVGVNNHMGSKLTQNRKAMKIVMEELHRRGLFFIDSKTIGSSIAAEVASEMGLRYAERDIFLDHVISDAFVKDALHKVETTARQKGYAIAIGHPHEITIRALREWLPTLKEKGLTLRPASAVVHYGSGAIRVAHEAEQEMQDFPQKSSEAANDNLKTEQEENPKPQAITSKPAFIVREDGSIIIP